MMISSTLYVTTFAEIMWLKPRSHEQGKTDPFDCIRPVFANSEKTDGEIGKFLSQKSDGREKSVRMNAA
jgi:hypothetical protein